MIKVLLVDDHQIVLDGLSSILDKVDGIQVMGTALNAQVALGFLGQQNIDIAVVDIEMPGKDGIELSKEIKHLYPETEVLILSMYKKNDMINGVIEAGGAGYILKNRGKQELEKAIRQIAGGEHYWGKELTQMMIDSLTNSKKEIKEKSPLLAPLSDREKQVLKLWVDGLTSQEIADQLFISRATVSTHRQHIRSKMGVSSKAVPKYAMDHELI